MEKNDYRYEFSSEIIAYEIGQIVNEDSIKR